jgi:DNA mismatch repair protein MutS
MGGKSTLLRSIALSVILAQIGCQVPAVSMQLSIVDKVFTRLGGTDDVLTGKSTFFCEMEETQHILT